VYQIVKIVLKEQLIYKYFLGSFGASIGMGKRINKTNTQTTVLKEQLIHVSIGEDIRIIDT